jgi:hypothetical protein
MRAEDKVHAVAVAELFLGMDDLSQLYADGRQRFGNHTTLLFDLALVTDVLPGAAPANAGVRAFNVHAIWRGLRDVNITHLGDTLLAADKHTFDRLAWNDKRRGRFFGFGLSDAATALVEGFHLEREFLAVLHIRPTLPFFGVFVNQRGTVVLVQAQTLFKQVFW